MDKRLKEFQKAEIMFKTVRKVSKKRTAKAKQIFGHVQVQTAGGQWKNDRCLMITKNPSYHHLETNYNLRDKRMLLKRREGTVMKNLALQQDLEVNNRKLDRELRKYLF